MVTTSRGQGRSQLAKAFTDPVVVGLGRLLMGIGLVALAGLLTLAWLILCGFRAL